MSADIQTEGGTDKLGFSGHDLMARLTWRFGGPAKKAAPAPEPAPAPQPVAAPAPEPAPVAPVVEEPKPAVLPGPFIVFFDFDRADVTAEAARVVSAAAAAFEKFGAVRIEATGHTDRAGAASYNDKLSASRADAVMAALVEAGVPADAIGVSSEGESNPLVTTDDGVREAQNRRVEIVLNR